VTVKRTTTVTFRSFLSTAKQKFTEHSYKTKYKMKNITLIILQQRLCSHSMLTSLHLTSYRTHKMKNILVGVRPHSMQHVFNVTLVDLQLDAQNSYLFTYNTFIKILYMFRALPCSSSGLRHNCIYAASGNVTLCRWLSCAPVNFFLNQCTRQSPAESDNTRVTYNTFIKILYMFWALLSSSSGGLRHNCIYAASGIVTLCRWLSCAPVKFFLDQCTRQCRE
jgi:hypothetical protein